MKSKALVSSFLELLIFEAHASLWACFSFTTAEEFNTVDILCRLSAKRSTCWPWTRTTMNISIGESFQLLTELN
ncbi:unnamed protein product [Linum tenue]|uniref:Secreted protein n=1 Tax=Linum tenue TaxID=586396 RepID=A0AAV0NUR5_9ROSI|nr:unnamed protein product [Linum tenue]